MNFVLFPDNYVISLVLNLFFFLVFFSVYFPVAIATSIPYLLTYLSYPFTLCCHPCQFHHPLCHWGPPSLPWGLNQSRTSPPVPQYLSHPMTPSLGGTTGSTRELWCSPMNDHRTTPKSHFIYPSPSRISYLCQTDSPCYYLPYFLMNLFNHDNGTMEPLFDTVQIPTTSISIFYPYPCSTFAYSVPPCMHFLPHFLWHLFLSHCHQSWVWPRRWCSNTKPILCHVHR